MSTSVSRACLALKDVIKTINSGSKADISKLTGIGNKTADQFLSAIKETPGKTITLRNVMAIKGVGSGTLSKATGNESVGDVIKFCKYYEETFGQPNKVCSRVVSLDLGMSTIAVASVTPIMSVLDWKCLQFIPPKPYSPCNLYKEVFLLLDKLSLTSDSILLLEGQSHRPIPSSAGYMDIGLRLRLIEGMIYSVARDRGIPTYCVSPRMVARYFETNARNGHYRKKQAATLVASHLVGAGGLKLTRTPLGNHLDVPKQLVESYWKQSKMDDLSDSLLQALAYHEWTDIYRSIW